MPGFVDTDMLKGATTAFTHPPVPVTANVSTGVDANTTFTWFPEPSSGQGAARGQRTVKVDPEQPLTEDR